MSTVEAVVTAPPASAAGRSVEVAPLHRSLVLLLPALALWMVVVVGRAVCLVAQRIPPLRRLVRSVRRWCAVRSARRAAGRAPRPRQGARSRHETRSRQELLWSAAVRSVPRQRRRRTSPLPATVRRHVGPVTAGRQADSR